MMKSVLFKVKENKLPIWLDWCQFLKKNEIEVVETLNEEKILFEGCLHFQILDTWYVLMFEEYYDAPLPATQKEINKIHMQKKIECFILVSKQEYDYLFMTIHGKK